MKFTTKLPADCICLTALLRFSMHFLIWVITVCSVISANLPACQSRRLIHLYENCRPTVILPSHPEKDEVCISILQLPARSLFRKSCFLSSRLKMIL